MPRFFAHTSSNIKPSQHFTLSARFTFYQSFFYNPKRASAAQVSWWLLRTRAGCLCSPISSSFTSELCFQIVLMQIEHSLIHHFLSTSLWSLCSYFQLAYLILSLLVLQNVSGEILAELSKMQTHDILISCPSFLGPSIFLILALLFASSYSIIILLINLHFFFPFSYIKWCLACFSLMALTLSLFSSVSISPTQCLASAVLDK